MWSAPKHEDPQRPKVTVSMCTPDPLGVMAMVNAQYTGRNLTSPSQVTDKERREAWHAATVSKLSETPLEWIQWSLNFENVSRALTHQMVRTRMATYAQESMRFAVKEDAGDAVKLPPSLAGTMSEREWTEKYGNTIDGVDESREQRWRNRWDEIVYEVDRAYNDLISDGMPAEDARGILPTNTLTRIHMRVDMKTLLNLAGMRLCTQAQFEWRAVFAELARAIRAYGDVEFKEVGNSWQFQLIADSFRPVCYAVGHCPMKADSDRACSIRSRVDAFAEAGISSDVWEQQQDGPGTGTSSWPAGCGPAAGRATDLVLHRIRPEEWLADPTAARVAPGRI
jgi:flavin-dependent thymidylate synthase